MRLRLFLFLGLLSVHALVAESTPLATQLEQYNKELDAKIKERASKVTSEPKELDWQQREQHKKVQEQIIKQLQKMPRHIDSSTRPPNATEKSRLDAALKDLELTIRQQMQEGTIDPASHFGPSNLAAGSARATAVSVVPHFKFPCELEKSAALPSIILNGEVHESASAKQKRHELEKKAAIKRCIVTEEGIYCGTEATLQNAPPKENVFGFDDAFTHGFSGLLGAFGKLNNNGSATESIEARLILLEMITSNESVREAWAQMLKTHPIASLQANDPSEAAIALVYSEMAREGRAEAGKRIKVLGLKHPFMIDTPALTSLLKKWIRAYVALATGEKYQNSKFVPEGISEKVDAYLNSSDPQTAFQTIAVDWRNQFMAANIAKLYCEQNLKSGLPLEVIAGQAHLEGLSQLLNAMAGGKVRIEQKSAFTKSMLDMTQIGSKGFEKQVNRKPPTPGDGFPSVGPLEPYGPPMSYAKPADYAEPPGSRPQSPPSGDFDR